MDILDRIIDFIAAATADPALFEAELDASTTGLPSVLLNELILQLREKPLRFEKKALSVSRVLHPTITYEVDDDEVVLVLPTPASDADVPGGCRLTETFVRFTVLADGVVTLKVPSLE